MSQDIFQRIQREIDTHPVILFMKGEKLFPQCGFSARVVQVLNRMGVEYQTVNVLEDAEIREGIKAFSQWPTIPQLYIKGEFVGGCDIVVDMYQNGELDSLLDEKKSSARRPDHP
ncbi:MAG: Grx4 family monothiol glutaredoxin [Acetobacteraceae bacterium]